MVLDKIKQPNDIKNLSEEVIKALPAEIREFLIDHLSKTGGHLASNLGTVELTIALHLLMDFPKDKLIWDVGHQAYTHKSLQEELMSLNICANMVESAVSLREGKVTVIVLIQAIAPPPFQLA